MLLDTEVTIGDCRGGGGEGATAVVAVVDASVETVEVVGDACFNPDPNLELKGLGSAAVVVVEMVVIEVARETPVLGQTAAGAVFGTRPLLMPLPPLLLPPSAGALSSSSVALLLEFIFFNLFFL